ncbi:cation transporter [Acinetobacter brisouii]|uniref:cation transporter n=1 Tax=Acinetobacter brisouii TaxID=396323 RepID=UPI00124FBFC7|nr:cation diffusion facilitator family transporter [Acinetobacter brisouii]
MAGCQCEHHTPKQARSKKFRNALWIAFFLNLSMFIIEVVVGIKAGSTALWADALDFAGDAFNYAISIMALGMSLYWRASIALVKGITMFAFAVLILVKVVWAYWTGLQPEAITMGLIGLLALVANVLSALVLYTFRDGDANMTSVWLCSRNDAIGNIAVILAAIGVFGTQSSIPDLVVAVVMASLGFSSGYHVIQKSRAERQAAKVT